MTQTSLICEQSPSEMAVERELVWTHINATIETDENSPSDAAPLDADYVDMLIEAAVSRLDGPNGLLNRALITQTWKVTFNSFPTEIVIPLARCQSVESIVYIDTSGAEITLDQSSYRVSGAKSDACRIRPVSSWPATLCDSEAVAVTFTSGFGDTAQDVPASIRLAIMEMVATTYAFREAAVVGAPFSVLPIAASRAVTDWTIWSP